MSGSHNLDRPSYKSGTGEEYSSLFLRIEESFNPEDMDKDSLDDWLHNETLSDALSYTSDVSRMIEEAETIEELKELKEEARTLAVHKKTLLNRIDSRIEELLVEEEERELAESISTIEDFAEERGITLSEKTKGKVYENWGKYHKPAQVIFSQGKIKAWRYI